VGTIKDVCSPFFYMQPLPLHSTYELREESWCHPVIWSRAVVREAKDRNSSQVGNLAAFRMLGDNIKSGWEKVKGSGGGRPSGSARANTRSPWPTSSAPENGSKPLS